MGFVESAFGSAFGKGKDTSGPPPPAPEVAKQKEVTDTSTEDNRLTRQRNTEDNVLLKGGSKAGRKTLLGQ